MCRLVSSSLATESTDLQLGMSFFLHSLLVMVGAMHEADIAYSIQSTCMCRLSDFRSRQDTIDNYCRLILLDFVSIITFCLKYSFCSTFKYSALVSEIMLRSSFASFPSEPTRKNRPIRFISLHHRVSLQNNNLFLKLCI